MEEIKDIRFRSDFYHDLQLQKEFNRGSRDGRLFYRLVYLYIICIFIWYFWYIVIQLDAADMYSNGALIMCGVWILVEGIWFLINRGGGIYYKRSLMLNSGKPTHDSVLFCEDHILTVEQESGNQATILYDNVRYAFETENLLLLGLRYATCLIVDKRGLSCTKDELGQFLYEKCPKLRRKKVRNSKWGIILRRAAWMAVLVSLLAAIYLHPVLQIDHRLKGQIHNGMSLTEIAAELESYGLGSLTADELNAGESPFYLADSKLMHLLFVMGEGIRDYDNGSFEPYENGVYFSYYWSEFPETMYTDFLRGIAAMSRGELVIEDIREDQSNTDWDAWEGTITLDFTLNGQPKTIDALFYGEWYDEQSFNTLNEMILEATGKQLYFLDFQDTGCFVFLGDESWAEAFSRRTGLDLSADINDIY